MTTAKDAELISPCGMNCALCSSYLAMKCDLKSRGVKMPYCVGCRPRNKTCAFVKKRCSKVLNGKVSFCFECNSFPCDMLKALDERYKARYRMSMIENLKSIRDNGIEDFLSKQNQVWKCKNCGQLICCHNGICYNCGLEELKNKKQKYRWNE